MVHFFICWNRVLSSKHELLPWKQTRLNQVHMNTLWSSWTSCQHRVNIMLLTKMALTFSWTWLHFRQACFRLPVPDPLFLRAFTAKNLTLKILSLPLQNTNTFKRSWLFYVSGMSLSMSRETSLRNVTTKEDIPAS